MPTWRQSGTCNSIGEGNSCGRQRHAGCAAVTFFEGHVAFPLRAAMRWCLLQRAAARCWWRGLAPPLCGLPVRLRLRALSGAQRRHARGHGGGVHPLLVCRIHLALNATLLLHASRKHLQHPLLLIQRRLTWRRGQRRQNKRAGDTRRARWPPHRRACMHAQRRSSPAAAWKAAACRQRCLQPVRCFGGSLVGKQPMQRAAPQLLRWASRNHPRATPAQQPGDLPQPRVVPAPRHGRFAASGPPAAPRVRLQPGAWPPSPAGTEPSGAPRPPRSPAASGPALQRQGQGPGSGQGAVAVRVRAPWQPMAGWGPPCHPSSPGRYSPQAPLHQASFRRRLQHAQPAPRPAPRPSWPPALLPTLRTQRVARTSPHAPPARRLQLSAAPVPCRPPGSRSQLMRLAAPRHCSAARTVLSPPHCWPQAPPAQRRHWRRAHQQEALQPAQLRCCLPRQVHLPQQSRRSRPRGWPQGQLQAVAVLQPLRPWPPGAPALQASALLQPVRLVLLQPPSQLLSLRSGLLRSTRCWLRHRSQQAFWRVP